MLGTPVDSDPAAPAWLNGIATDVPNPVVVVYSLDDPATACPQIRIIRPLLSVGWQLIWAANRVGHRWQVDTTAAATADLILVQRAFPSQPMVGALKALVRLGVPIVYDTDDSFFTISPDHPAGSYIRSTLPYVQWMLREADLITVSTPHLKADLSRRTRRPVVVVPNLVDTSLFRSGRVGDLGSVRILVAGTRTHLKDWQLVVSALTKVLAKRPEVSVVFYGGLPEGLLAGPRVFHIPFQEKYQDYADTLTSTEADLALVPLLDTEFNRAKSNIKWLEYSAIGMPAIFSDLALYRDHVEHGRTGWLAQNSLASWYAMINLALDDLPGVKAVGAQAQAAVCARYSIHTSCLGYVAPWRALFGARHRRAWLAGRHIAWPQFRHFVHDLWLRHFAWRFAK